MQIDKVKTSMEWGNNRECEEAKIGEGGAGGESTRSQALAL